MPTRRTDRQSPSWTHHGQRGYRQVNVAGDEDIVLLCPKTPTVGVPKHVKTGGRDLVPT